MCISVLGLLIYYLEAPILFIFIPLLFLIFAPFLDVPQGVKSGKLVYLSPFLLQTSIRGDNIELHGGTLFDYYFILDPQQNARERKRLILKYYVMGLLNLIEKFRDRPKPLKITATTYFIGAQTAKKFGFTKTRSNFIQKIILFFNYIPLLISLSMANKRLTFPKLRNVSSIASTLEELQNKEKTIIAYYEKLQ